MINTKLNIRLKANYEKRVRDYLNQLKKDGYLISSDIEITGSQWIVHYDCEKQDFLTVCHISDFFDEHIDRKVRNPFNINLTYSEIQALIVEVLPHAISFDLEDFLQYEKYELDYIGTDELNDELKDFTNLSKTLTKQIDMNNFTSANNQALMLNSELVFYTGNCNGNISEQRSYFKYNKKNKSFEKMSANDIHELLVKKFKINKNSLDLQDIKKNMRGIYKDAVNTSSLPIRWNSNVEAKKKLNIHKQNYEEIKSITNCFE